MFLSFTMEFFGRYTVPSEELMTEMTQILVTDMHADLRDIHAARGKQFTSNLQTLISKVFKHRQAENLLESHFQFFFTKACHFRQLCKAWWVFHIPYQQFSNILYAPYI